jgi:hypothetical protein
MGNLLSFLIPRRILRMFRRADPKDKGSVHLPGDEESQRAVATTKRRALLVGISYCSPSNTWSRLDGPHEDVDQYRELLMSA